MHKHHNSLQYASVIKFIKTCADSYLSHFETNPKTTYDVDSTLIHDNILYPPPEWKGEKNVSCTLQRVYGGAESGCYHS